ncbi:hypothetical protein KIPB_012690, partial [Kipferlia bialata]
IVDTSTPSGRVSVRERVRQSNESARRRESEMPPMESMAAIREKEGTPSAIANAVESWQTDTEESSECRDGPRTDEDEDERARALREEEESDEEFGKNQATHLL